MNGTSQGKSGWTEGQYFFYRLYIVFLPKMENSQACFGFRQEAGIYARFPEKSEG
jgi:hypothetical protein